MTSKTSSIILLFITVFILLIYLLLIYWIIPTYVERDKVEAAILGTNISFLIATNLTGIIVEILWKNDVKESIGLK
jgi:uncharacterized BrkB/YihY/UPF0761 family membrane protein